MNVNDGHRGAPSPRGRNGPLDDVGRVWRSGVWRQWPWLSCVCNGSQGAAELARSLTQP